MSLTSNKRQAQKQVGQWSGGFSQDFAVVEAILRNRQHFFEEIRENKGIGEKIQGMLIASLIFLALYGAVLGSTHSLIQAVISAAKLPLLFLATMFICIPTLYIFSVLCGSTLRLNQTIALVLTAITTIAVLILSFAPIVLFFMLTTSVANGYQFFKLLNVAFFAVAGMVGMQFLHKGMGVVTVGDGKQGQFWRDVVLELWIILYAFVGSQMAWTLRPFIGYPGANLEIIRQLGGNFYSDIFRSIGEFIGLFIVR